MKHGRLGEPVSVLPNLGERPHDNGIKLMRTLPALSDIPLIFVSACVDGDMIARPLEAGAADCIVKPFSPAEREARVSLAPRWRTAPKPFRIGDLEIGRAKRRVTLPGRPVRLTATECRRLHTLSLDADGTTTYETVRRRIWGDRSGAKPQAVRDVTR